VDTPSYSFFCDEFLLLVSTYKKKCTGGTYLFPQHAFFDGNVAGSLGIGVEGNYGKSQRAMLRSED